ncbi:MAG: hypothetical protein JOZ72_12700 [Alphaproteobacteria bacterium]|nr:hypothetical protein [Alphaproteobacteria bacterium]
MKTKLALAFLALTVGAAQAQSDDSERLRAQLRQVTLQLRQAQDDQAAAQAQKIAAQMERDAVKKQLAAAQGDLARLRHDSGRASAAEGQLAKANAALAAAGQSAEKDKAERDKIQADAVTQAGVLSACEGKNRKLLDVSRQILKAYEDFDFVDSLGAREPFIRLRRVELENLAQDYRDRIDDGAFDAKTDK